MQGLNRIFLLGYLGNNPQIYATKNGKQYVGLSVATHRQVSSDSQGENKKDSTDWHYVRVWGRQAENCAKYLNKGQAGMVEGYLTQYELPKDGDKKERKVSINAIKVDFLPRTDPTAELNQTAELN